MRPEGGEAETSQPTPEGEEHEAVGWEVPFSVTTPQDSTQQCPAQPNKGRGTEGMHCGNLNHGGQ